MSACATTERLRSMVDNLANLFYSGDALSKRWGKSVNQITVQDCLEKIGNHFALTILAAERARHLFKGSPATVNVENRYAITALREIAAGNFGFAESLQETLEKYLYWMRNRGVSMGQSAEFQSE